MLLTAPAPSSASDRARSGAALILVLSALALISFIVLAILTFARSEDRSARAAADLVQVRMLATLPEKLVISQLRRATRDPANSAASLGMKYTWTSQPGMIRVFGTTTASATSPRAEVEKIYKLYSARELTLADKTRLFDDRDQLMAWDASPAAFVDLNEPVRVKAILNQPSTHDRVVFPILDPRANGLANPSQSGLVDGFTIDNARPAGGYGATTDPPTMAMPVSWLYVLQDGSVIAPGDSPNLTATFNNSAPSAKNPIVGRIAFWTDDESCKLNLNTASEPAPWDSPHTHTTTDEAYAASLPAKGEFYRAPGHPAYTSLSPVLRKLSPGTPADPEREPFDPIGGGNKAQWWQHLRDWHSMLPRSPDIDTNTGTEGGTVAPTTEVKPKKDRLFATVDELAFKDGSGTAGSVRITNQQGQSPVLNEDNLSTLRFFLTPHSRAPELNPFNRPKISLWPVQKSASSRNQLDKAFVRASTLGSDIYCFQRDAEWTGEGSPSSSQDPFADMSLARNLQLYGYLQDFSEMDVPGFGGKFVDSNATNSKWTDVERDQVLTSMFDFLRWGVNPSTPHYQKISPPLKDYYYLPTSFGEPGTSYGLGGHSAVPSLFAGSGDAPFLPTGSAPAQTVYTKGYGRFPTITEVALVFIPTKVLMQGGKPAINNNYPQYAGRTKGVQAFVILEPFCAAPGTTPVAPAVTYRIHGLDGLTLEGHNLGFKAADEALNTALFSPANTDANNSTKNTAWGGDHSAYSGMCSQFLQLDGTPKHLPRKPDDTYPAKFFLLASDPVKSADITQWPGGNMLGYAGTKLAFSGGHVTIEILSTTLSTTGEFVPGEVVQVIEVEFPFTHIPVPLVAEHDFGTVDPSSGDCPPLDSRFHPSVVGKPRFPDLIMRGDVVRSMELAGSDADFTASPTGKRYPGAVRGDARLLAGRYHVEASNNVNNASEHYLIPHHDYFQAEGGASPVPAADIDKGRQAHSLRDGAYMLEPQPGFAIKDGENDLKEATTASTAGSLVVAMEGHKVLAYAPGALPATPPNIPDDRRAVPATPPGAINGDNRPGDFDNGPGIIEDGPYINMPDFANGKNEALVTSSSTSKYGSYFQRGGQFEGDDGTTFSPWRQITSAIAFGSLPTGVYGIPSAPSTPRPWQTLLFCPNPASRSTPAGSEPSWVPSAVGAPKPAANQDHYGFKTPRDHLWLEYFWMPPVEPEGLCDGLATEGKVNMNYQIMPFTWIKRATAMHGALHGVRITAIPSSTVAAGGNYYKDPNTALKREFRYAVDAEKTLEAFDDRFNDPSNPDVFHSPSEICEMFLVPKKLPADHPYVSGAPDPDTVISRYTDCMTWWEGKPGDPTDAFEATGDNLREAPYAQLYPRLCTRSNVFTVHYRVQLLRKSRSTKPEIWDERADNVAAEYRGQTTVERYLDPNTTAVPDFVAAQNSSKAVDDYYKYRIVSRQQFAP